MTDPHIVIDQPGGRYPVFIAGGLLPAAGAICADVSNASFALVVTPPSTALAAGDVAHSLAAAGFRCDTLVFDDGEEQKTMQTAEAIVTALLQRRAKRDSLVVAAGGGVIGDTAGFAAAIFLRGIDLVHLPTTLLAMVDSSIGGKVAVNHSMGKNLIGAFHPPRAVIADVDLLATLPMHQRLSGVFEALKGGVIGDRQLFDLLAASPRAILQLERPLLLDVIRRAVAVKAEIVASDEREGDRRRLLNYGHTVGHGIEAAMGYRGITHGEAVAWGMIAANAVARGRGIIAADELARIDSAIRSFEPRALPPLDRAAVRGAIEHDKKFRGDKRVMVLPRAIGLCEVFDDVTEREIDLAIDAAIDQSAER